MDTGSIKTLVSYLKEYPHRSKKMQTTNFSMSSVKAFKRYANVMHLELIKYIKFKEDKKLSELAKQLKLSKDIFVNTDRWIALLSIVIVFSGILLIYMYNARIQNEVMILMTLVVVVVVFFLIKKVQEQPDNLINELHKNEKVCDKIASYIQNN